MSINNTKPYINTINIVSILLIIVLIIIGKWAIAVLSLLLWLLLDAISDKDYSTMIFVPMHGVCFIVTYPFLNNIFSHIDNSQELFNTSNLIVMFFMFSLQGVGITLKKCG